MNILVAELQPAKGHRNLCLHTCKILSKIGKVTIVDSLSDDISEDKFNVIRYPFGYYQGTNKRIDIIQRTLHSVYIINFVSQIYHNGNYDIFIGITYDELAYALAWRKLRNVNVFLMQHNNFDIANHNFLKKIALKYIFSFTSIKIITQCNFIAEYAKYRYKLDSDKIIIWPHPLNIVSNDIEIYDCVGISNSNDEKIIEDIIKLEEESKIFARKGLKIILKSKSLQYDDGSLKVINGFLSEKEYNEYISKSKIIFMPFSKFFKYRMSGTLMDAFSNYKPIIVTSSPLSKACQNVYPSIIKDYDVDSFLKSIMEFRERTDVMKKEFDRFISFHDDSNLINIIENTIDNSLNGKIQNKFGDF